MTSNDLLIQPPSNLTPATALLLSQQAPRFLLEEPTSSPNFPISLFRKSETSESWIKFETLLSACLRAGDDKSARDCLEKLTERFGNTNERVMGLRGMYEEAVAEDQKSLEDLLDHYNKILEADAVNMPVAKRRITLLKSLSRQGEAIGYLVELLGISPTDAEAWCELSDLYQSQGLGSQAIFCLEEALLITPNAWSLHARMGELNYIMANQSNTEGAGVTLKYVVESMRRFCRSIELCNNYLRGYYGLKMATAKLLEVMSAKGAIASYEGDMPSRENVQALNKLATQKLTFLVNTGPSCEAAYQAQIIAARALLDGDTSAQT